MALYIIGSGGFGNVIGERRNDIARISCVLEESAGYFDGDDGKLDDLEFVRANRFIVAIEDQVARRRLSEKVADRLDFLIAHGADVAQSAKIGKGSMVLSGAIVDSQAMIGRFCIVHIGSIIGHHCVLKDNVQVCDGAVLAGDVMCEEDAFIGANATVLPRVKIGNGAIVGAGAVVLEDVPAGSKVVGNPARIIL
jgi:sugar O-acyltransferase (sialic acid O-acetyltransferase NeuD family)